MSAHFLGLPFGWGAIFSLIAAIFGGGSFGVWVKSKNDLRKNLAQIAVEQSKVDVEADEKLRAEMWKDIEALKIAKEDQSRRLTLAETHLVQQSIELGQHRFLIKLLIDELNRVSPDNPVAKQVREMLMEMQRQAIPAAEEVGPMAEIMSKLCRTEPDDGGGR